MDGLILCRTRVADNPYYISEGDVCIYTLEELCYYLYNHIYMLSSDFLNDNLVRFIDRELGEQELADALRKLLNEEAALWYGVLTILMNVDYYSKEEINELRKVIDRLDSLKGCERLKICGDKYLADHMCESALKSYSLALAAVKKDKMDELFLGEVYHNMGVAYGRMLLYEQASQYFLLAYKKAARQESMEQYVIAQKLFWGEDYQPKEADEDTCCKALSRIVTAMDAASLGAWCREAKEAAASKEKGKSDLLIEKYKEDCLCCMR